MLKLRGIRGATTADANNEAAILDAARTLLVALQAANGFDLDDVASVIFTMTPDLNATYPAKAARLLGWHHTPLLGCQEIDNPNGSPLTIRVLIHWNTTRKLDEIVHVYQRGAAALRPDLNSDLTTTQPMEGNPQ